MYNHSLRSADRATHLKIVLIPLVAVALFALAAVNAGVTWRTGAGAGVHAGHQATHMASSATIAVR